ncbi:YkvA family protein [Clostridium uliginosum]|uniref:Uncharacterized membrane protein YkvA, DUF1232 family n=1 Tax=Clostridium uliginosum TaxID=119641 RepID=A0A1I1HUX4_9CLOT|nr:DUF1232 domain-containing protein [Clostridium uliginosum]SFC27595.1 Uncharacterized membrane protein YkvA, DUF1232 family [Clostridium uliginosum]
MKISNVKVKLVGEDILSIINDFVKVDGLTLNKINIVDGILIQGNLKKGFSVDFSLKIETIECIDEKLIGRVSNFKVMKLGLFRMIRSFLLKKLVEDFKDKGITTEKDKIIVDINKILEKVPFVDLKIKEVFVKGAEVWVEAEDINISLKGELVKEINAEVVEEPEKENDKEVTVINKVNDNYSKGRKILEDKLPEKSKKLKNYIFVLPDIVSLIYRLLKDERVPVKTKVIMSSAIAYITLPTDIIPNNIPFIGAIDEIGVAFFALNNVINDVSLNVIMENWEGKNDIIIVLKDGLEYLINFTGAKNVERLYEVINEIATL